MDKRKALGIVVILAVLAIVSAVYLGASRSAAPKPAASAVAFNPQDPPFIYGTFISATASQVQFQVGADTKTATINSQTKLVKQMTNAQGVPAVVTAALSDFKPNAEILVYFDAPANGNSYTATKIQIIGQ